MNFDLASKLYALPGIIVGLTVHEFAHAYTAYRLGDDTARSEGRLTLNPLRHIDPLGFLFLVVAGFGWAKPVHFDRSRLAHPKRDEAAIALAGPASNLVLGLLLALVLKGLFMAGVKGPDLVFDLLLYGVYLNYGLFIFNLIPLPPLDGSHLFFSALSLSPETEAKLYRWGSLGLIGILMGGMVLDRDLLPIGRLVRSLSQWTFRLLGLL